MQNELTKITETKNQKKKRKDRNVWTFNTKEKIKIKNKIVVLKSVVNCMNIFTHN